MKKLLTILLLILATPAHAKQEAPPLPYSDFQREFMQINIEFSRRYPTLQNELQKSALVAERFDRFKKLKGDPRVIKNWLGVLEGMGTNGDGKAFVTIRLTPKELTFSTWNNSFSDMSDHSLIPQSSPVFKKLATMKIGNVVKFSGRLKHTKNLTEDGKMTTPDFLFIFKDIEKIGESATPF